MPFAINPTHCFLEMPTFDVPLYGTATDLEPESSWALMGAFGLPPDHADCKSGNNNKQINTILMIWDSWDLVKGSNLKSWGISPPFRA